MKSHSIFLKSVLFFLILFASSHGQESNTIDITIERDGILLQGKIYVSKLEGKFPTVILLHGFPGGEGDVLGIGKKLSEVDINVLSFNYSGTHKSEGEFNFDNSQRDIRAAFDFIRQSANITKFKIDTTRILLGGYNYGGGMAFTYAANHPEVEEVFSIAGNNHGAFFREYNRDPAMRKEFDQMFDKLKARTEVVRFGPGGTAKEIAEMMGCKVLIVHDVGVAGIHRLFEPLNHLLSNSVDVIIVAAGMEGALPTVVAGLVDVPIIGLPISSGYGYGGKGKAALMSMLQSCSLGVAVVNIDGGVSAGAIAAKIARKINNNKKEAD